MQVSPNYVVGMSAALFIVWMQRHKRWANVIGAMDGTYKIRAAS